MATVSFRVPDDLKERMDDHPEVNWSAVLREEITEELDRMDERNLARAVLVGERLSNSVDPEAVDGADAAGLVRAWRDRRYGPGGEGPGHEDSSGERPGDGGRGREGPGDGEVRRGEGQDG